MCRGSDQQTDTFEFQHDIGEFLRVRAYNVLQLRRLMPVKSVVRIADIGQKNKECVLIVTGKGIEQIQHKGIVIET